MKATLKPGQWFMYPIDSGIPSKVWIYEGEVHHRKRVQEISKYQALALARWHGDSGVYYSYKDGNDRWQDVYVVGDIDAWFGDDSEGGAVNLLPALTLSGENHA